MWGRVSLFYSFKNNSQSLCTLRGWPRYVLLDGAGRPLKAKNMAGEGVPDDPKAGSEELKGKGFTHPEPATFKRVGLTNRNKLSSNMSAERDFFQIAKENFIHHVSDPWICSHRHGSDGFLEELLQPGEQNRI
jgi:hypothetical protein